MLINGQNTGIKTVFVQMKGPDYYVWSPVLCNIITTTTAVMLLGLGTGKVGTISSRSNLPTTASIFASSFISRTRYSSISK